MEKQLEEFREFVSKFKDNLIFIVMNKIGAPASTKMIIDEVAKMKQVKPCVVRDYVEGTLYQGHCYGCIERLSASEVPLKYRRAAKRHAAFDPEFDMEPNEEVRDEEFRYYWILK